LVACSIQIPRSVLHRKRQPSTPSSQSHRWSAHLSLRPLGMASTSQSWICLPFAGQCVTPVNLTESAPFWRGCEIQRASQRRPSSSPARAAAAIQTSPPRSRSRSPFRFITTSAASHSRAQSSLPAKPDTPKAHTPSQRATPIIPARSSIHFLTHLISQPSTTCLSLTDSSFSSSAAPWTPALSLPIPQFVPPFIPRGSMKKAATFNFAFFIV